MRISCFAAMCLTASIASAQAVELPVASQSTEVILSDDGSTVLLVNDRVLWSPVDAPIAVPYRGLALSAHGHVVLHSVSDGVGFWGPEIGSHNVALYPFPCGGGWTPVLFAPDGTWASGVGTWPMAGPRYCYWQVNYLGLLVEGYGRATSQYTSVALDNQGSVQSYYTFDLDQYGRTTTVVLCWSGGGCVSVPVIEEAPYPSLSASRISGSGNTAFIRHDTGLRRLLYRYDSSGAAELMTPTHPGDPWAQDLSFDGRIALLRYSQGSGSYYLYDHFLRTEVSLASMLVHAGVFPTLPTLINVDMDWSGTVFVVKARLGDQDPYRWYYVNLPEHCPFDLDYSFDIDSDDIIEFFRLYEESRADFDNDGDTDSDDIAAFFDGFEAGC